MRGRKNARIEAVADYLAAAVFAVAAGFSAFALLAGTVDQPQLSALAAGSAIVAYVAAAGLLRRVGAKAPTFEIRAFRMADLELEEPEELLLTEQVELLLTEQVELVLTDADRLRPSPATSSEELVLDDILAKLDPGSRVVRLFDPAAMPTPGQLDARIQQHLREGNSPTAPDPIGPPDASQALHEALAELRRSLR